MTIRSVQVTAFALPLRHPLVTAAGTITCREGFVVEVVGDDGHRGVGEASPPYWLGDETFAATAAVLAEAPALAGDEEETLAAVVEAWRPRSAAAACALDTARVDLAARRRGMPLASWLRSVAGVSAPGGVLPEAVATAVLLGGTEPAALARAARAAIARGHRCLKLKVGGGTLADDVARVSAVRAAIGAAPRLRLDANRAWRVDEARAALAALAPFAPDFIEEPLCARDALAWGALRDLGVTLAADESVSTAADCARVAGVADVLVVKAARLGGPTATMALAADACARGLRVVVTDAIETVVGSALATHLAAVLHAPDDAVGLGGAQLLTPGPAVPVSHPSAVVTGPGLGVCWPHERGALAS
jgi:o-succinylbenzoate synthase